MAKLGFSMVWFHLFHLLCFVAFTIDCIIICLYNRNNARCTSKRPQFGCNRPSELCNPYLQWIQLWPWLDTSHITQNGCDGWDVAHSAADGSTSLITNRQWINENRLLVIEYTLRINDVIWPCGTGIQIRNFGNLCDTYGIRISRILSGDWKIVLQKNINYKYYKLGDKLLDDPIEFGIDYTLTVKVQNGNEFEILMNNESVINFTDVYDTVPVGLNSIQSGYISLNSYNTSITARYLYVSGGFVVEDNDDYHFGNCLPVETASMYSRFMYFSFFLI